MMHRIALAYTLQGFLISVGCGRSMMRNFIIRLFLALALVVCVTVLGASANAQEPNSQEPAAATPPPQQSPSASPQDQQTPPANPPEEPPQEPSAGQQNEPQMPASGTSAETGSPTLFTGRIVKENGKVVLKDPITKTSYRIGDSSKAKPFMGKQVKVTGKLDISSNTIKIEDIEPLSRE
jgi:Protein of unknown function (DUF5818)